MMYDPIWMEDNYITKEWIAEQRNSLINFIETSQTKICVLPSMDAVWFSVVADILCRYDFECKGSFITIYK